jgi:class 3 adenylate cyclase/tetratricopeptide (TPR) repeat protein
MCYAVSVAGEVNSVPPVSEADRHERELLRRAAAYLPSTLLAAIDRHRGGQAHFIEPTDGTLVFADVSGFTPLSEGLAATGREGAERLTAVLNDFFGRMLVIAAKWGGSNQKFGGDAMLLLFVGPDHARRSVEAALEMQAETKRFPAIKVATRRHKLAMSLGIHSGRFWSAAVGEPETRMQHVLIGFDTARVADAEGAASAGQVVVSEQTRELLDGGVATTPIEASPGMHVIDRRRTRAQPRSRSGVRRLPNDVSLRAFLPPPLALALARDDFDGRLEDEHRRVVVLFISVVGLNQMLAARGPEAALEQAQAYVSTLAKLTARHGGFISGNDIDGKGLKLIVLFGAPVTRDDDAASALRLAAELIEAIRDLDLEVQHRIGINAGYVFAGDVGSDLRRDYTVIGDAVNLAARLMGAAESGQVVVADWVVSEAGPGFDLADSRSIRVKGKSMSIPVHTLTGARDEAVEFTAPAGRLRQVIGRERERRSLRHASDRAEEGVPQLLTVHGEAGVGGSTLVAELLSELADKGWTVYRGRAQQHLRDVPFAPVSGLFERMLGIADITDPDARTATAIAALDSVLPSMGPMAALLNGVISIDAPESDIVRSLDPPQRAERLTGLLVRLVAAHVANEPLVVMVEGLHASDRATIGFLERGSREWKRGRLLAIVTYRNDLAPHFAPQRSRTVDVELGPLSRADSDALVRHLLGQDDVSEALLGEIFQRARGNPLVTRELVRAVGASDLLDDPAGIDPRRIQELLGGLDVPDRLQQLVMARIDRLPPAPRWVLTRAAVVGTTFNQAALAALPGADSERISLTAALQQLVEVTLIDHDPDGRQGWYAFRHEAIRDVAYDSLLFRTRRTLHRDLARYFTSVHTVDIEREAATIAHHYRIAGDHAEAGSFSVRAGDQALASFAIEEAEASFTLAFDDFDQAGKDHVAQRSFASERLGDCASLAGRPLDAVRRQQQALRSWRRATAEAEPVVERHISDRGLLDQREAELCRKVALAQQRSDHYHRALEWLDRAQQAMPEQAPLLGAKLAALRGGTLFRLGRYGAASDEGRRALELAEQTSDQATVAYARDLLASIFLEQGRLQEAIEQRTAAVQIFEAEGDLRGTMGGHNNLGAAFQLVGALADAQRHYERAAEAAARLGNVQGRAIIENNIGEVLLAQGQLDEAAARFAITVEVHTETGQAAVWAGLALVNLSRVAARRGDLDEAHRVLERGTGLLRRARARGLLLEAAQQRIALLVAAGDLVTAARSNRRLANEARELGMQLFEARSAILEGRIALLEGDRGRATAALRRAVGFAEAAGARPEQAEAWAVLASAGLDPGAAERSAALHSELGVTGDAWTTS